jgi:predicted Zn-dependent protease
MAPWHLVCAILVVLTIAAGAQQDLAPSLAGRFSEGVAALKSGRLDDAERAFRDVLENGGERAFVHHNLGIVLQQRGRHRDALIEFRAAARLDPSFGPAPLLAGVSLLAIGRPREAVAELERAVRLMPDEPASHLQLADAYERTANIDGVVQEYRRLVQLAPASDEYAYRLGKAYLKLAQWSYERIRVINPHSARLAQALGQQYLEQNRPGLASRAFEEAARIDPRLAGIHLALARIHLDGGRLDDAAAEVARERTIEPESAAARAVQADIDAARKRR